MQLRRFLGLILLLPLAASGLASADTPKGFEPVQQLVDLGKDLGLIQDADHFLPADEAFQFRAEFRDANTIAANWIIAEGYYLYRDKTRIRLEDSRGIQIKDVQFPPGEIKEDEFFGRMEVYHNDVEILASLGRPDYPPAGELTLLVTYQGCAERGICYPPIYKSVVLTPANADAPAIAQIGATSSGPPLPEQDRIAQSLLQNNLLLTVLSFLGFGFLLAFTPCVFPMIPILSSILVGQGKDLTPWRGFNLSSVYVLAMALTYTLAGIVAGLFGNNLQATFQNPWTIGGFAAVFVILALSMFGFYRLQMPVFIQSRLAAISSRQRGGTTAGVAVMGLLSALIVGPCVAAPLAGALIYIGQTGDAILGGLALFALSMGMGIPLLALGAGAGKLLPRTGEWMYVVNRIFGVLLLAVAIWLLDRILAASVTLGLWAALFIVSSIYLGALDSLGPAGGGWKRLWKGVGLVSLVYGIVLLVGAASGGKDLLRPLQGLDLIADGGRSSVSESGLVFHPIKSVADLEGELRTAAQRSEYVMLDFYADWCVTCKEMEKYTFPKQDVRKALADVRLLQADVTAYDVEDRELLKKLRLIGPPSILFFGPDGEERRNFRLVGFMDAEQFRDHIVKFKSI